MEALITGGAGFIGSHLSEELLSRGQVVSALDDLSTGSPSNVEHLLDVAGFNLHQGTILDWDELSSLMKRADIIYHLAAAVGVRYVLDHPVSTLETNTRGTENVLRLANQLGNKKVIIASSSEVYGKTSKVPFHEDDGSVLGPTSIVRWGYSCSKALDEVLALAYYREKGLPVLALRFFNTVGPRQTGRYGMVVPRFVSQAMAGSPITVYGDGRQTRSFTYVRDLVRAMADLAMVPSAEGQVFNIGSNAEISINALAELVRDVLHSPSEIVHVPFSEVYGPDFDETAKRSADISKIQGYINYRPRTDLAPIIKEISEDLRPALDGAEAKGAGGSRGESV